jgi:spermidine synthase
MDDARNYIGVVDRDFDVIATDVTNLKYKRNPYLYTREYFEIMQDALAADGIAAAWLPLGGLSFEDLRILIATFDRVYPHTTVWYFTQYATHFVIAVGTPKPTQVDLEGLTQKLNEMNKVRDDLKTIKVDDAYEIAGMLLLGEQDVDKLVAGAPIHTDDRPILEFSDMDQYGMIDVEPNLKRLLAYQTEDLGQYFTGTDRERSILKRHFAEYQRDHKRSIRRYERTARPKVD